MAMFAALARASTKHGTAGQMIGPLGVTCVAGAAFFAMGSSREQRQPRGRLALNRVVCVHETPNFAQTLSSIRADHHELHPESKPLSASQKLARARLARKATLIESDAHWMMEADADWLRDRHRRTQ